MSRTQVVTIDPLRVLAEASIAATYAPVGTPFTEQIRLVCFTNTTDADMIFSDDGVTDKLIVPASSFKLFDLTTNRIMSDDIWCLQVTTQFYVRYVTVPTMGSVYIEGLWGQ